MENTENLKEITAASLIKNGCPHCKNNGYKSLEIDNKTHNRVICDKTEKNPDNGKYGCGKAYWIIDPENLS